MDISPFEKAALISRKHTRPGSTTPLVGSSTEAWSRDLRPVNTSQNTVTSLSPVLPGSGKTYYMACAFGMVVCKQRYKTQYVRLPDMLLELDMSRGNGTYRKALARYANPVLLIIDEWLLLKPSLTASSTMPTRSVSSRRIPQTTAPWERYMGWTRH